MIGLTVLRDLVWTAQQTQDPEAVNRAVLFAAQTDNPAARAYLFHHLPGAHLPSGNGNSGRGNGYGDGYGDGYGNGNGTGGGNGYGNGRGNGYGDGYGDGNGDSGGVYNDDNTRFRPKRGEMEKGKWYIIKINASNGQDYVARIGQCDGDWIELEWGVVPRRWGTTRGQGELLQQPTDNGGQCEHDPAGPITINRNTIQSFAPITSAKAVDLWLAHAKSLYATVGVCAPWAEVER